MTCDCCGGGQTPPIPDVSQKLVIAALLWLAAFFAWPQLIAWLIFDLLAFSVESSIGVTLQTTLNLIGHFTLWFGALTYVATWLQTSVRLETIRARLSHRSTSAQILVALLFGAVTPIGYFESRTLFLGLGQIKKPKGTAAAYLCANLLFHRTLLAVIGAVSEWQFMLIYIAFATIASLLATLLMKKVKLSLPILAVMTLSAQEMPINEEPLPCIHERFANANTAVRQALSKSFIWIIVGSIVFATLLQNPIVGLLIILLTVFFTLRHWTQKDPLSLREVMSNKSARIFYQYAFSIMAILSYGTIWL